jgi:hypothetical protein
MYNLGNGMHTLPYVRKILLGDVVLSNVWDKGRCDKLWEVLLAFDM